MSQLLLHTPGEPAGIGPELLLRLAQQPSPHCRVAIADGRLLQATARHFQLPLELRPRPHQPEATPAGVLWHEPVERYQAVPFGQPSPDNAEYLLNTLRRACQLARAPGTAVVTGPLHKASIAHSGVPFTGHTEFLAEQCGGAMPVMMLVSGSLRVALATTHLPLRAVPDALNRQQLGRCLQILSQDLRQRFGIDRPRIQVCGLNPHAGESGALGSEEQSIIIPALRDQAGCGAELLGPVPADTAFTPARLANCDAVLSMYHDQGLPVLKHAGFGQAVNVTLGLPIIRTSVDHGTAFDIAGTGEADLGSLLAAEQLAADLSRHGT